MPAQVTVSMSPDVAYELLAAVVGRHLSDDLLRVLEQLAVDTSRAHAAGTRDLFESPGLIVDDDWQRVVDGDQ